MNDALPPAPSRRPARWLLPLAVVVVLGAAGYAGWHHWQQQQRDRAAQAQTTDVRLKGLEATVEALRRDQRATSQRLQDAAATNRVLRAALGLSQRSALLEENLTRLTESANQGRQAVQRDEAELLLTQAAQRLAFADDVEGARRLYAQAATALADLPDNEGLNLRQALVQERDALDALGPGPRVQALHRLNAVAQALQGLPSELPPSPAEAAAKPWWQSALAPFVDITPTRLNGPLTQAERAAADDALQLELTLARAAIERGDRSGRDAALNRVAHWAQRRWPDSPGLRAQHAELQALRKAPLQAESSVLGSTLQQLRSQTDRR